MCVCVCVYVCVCKCVCVCMCAFQCAYVLVTWNNAVVVYADRYGCNGGFVVCIFDIDVYTYTVP